ncbi:MAG: LAGLIDADG family homing endonuclease [Candidatus Heimdallarchaeota archaeon]
MEAVVPEPKDSESLRSFFTDFMDESGNYLYKEQIEALITRGKRSLIIDFDDLLRFDPDLAKKLLKSPDLFIQTFEKDFRELIESMDPEYAAKVDRFHLRFRKVPDKENLRDIRAKHIGKIIEIEGILTRVTEIKPLLIEAVFRCTYCKGDLMVIPQKEGRYRPPEQCLNPECGRKGGIVFLPEESTFIDWQRISIQEKPENLPPGRMPQSMSLILHDDVVDIARPGDRIKATGILRSRPEKALKPGKLATFYRYIESNFLERVESEMETQEITPAEEKQIQELGKDPWIAQKIVNSIAPSIYGYDHIKEALALLLFGGITKHLPDKTTIRGEPNVLLIGDPGTGKSQILKYIATLAPRGLYTSGKGSTAAGLCVSADSDILFSDGIVKIGEIVEEELKEGNLEKYNDIMEFKKNQSNNRQILHSSNLKLQSRKIDKFWRIKSPSKLQRIVSKTGKELKLTAETSVFSITEKDGLVWIPAKSLKLGDRIASMRKLPVTTFKEIPIIFDLIKDYPGRITLLKMEAIVKEIIEKIMTKKDLSLKKISHKLNVSTGALRSWLNEEMPGNVSLRYFITLCELIGENVEQLLPDKLHLQIKNGQTIILPKQLDEDWFYIMGLLIGDGHISIDQRESGYGGVKIGLSNRNKEILNYFQTFFSNLGFKVTITEGNDERAAEYRIWSKLMYHIYSKFGLCSSPKSTNINPNKEILFFEEKYLNSFLKGTFDSDGWIFVRREGSSHIGFSSTSKKLIKFVQYGLLRSGIIPYIRERQPKVTITSSGKKITAKNVKYELTFANYNEILTFKEKIGFNHPEKQTAVKKYCQRTKAPHRNDDNIPGITSLLKEIVGFYNYTSHELVGYKAFFSPSNRKDSISHQQLKSILEKIDPNWHRFRVKIPYEIRNTFYKEIQKDYSIEQIEKITKTSRNQLYEYFIRKGRNPAISIGIIIKLFNSDKVRFDSYIHQYFTNRINEIHARHEYYLSKYELLKSLCLSDIFWDEVAFVEELDPDEPYVYDLTIPKTHNFIVNGFVVHNTAAVIKDPTTGELNLEAGALVLSDKGIACIDEFDKMRPDDRVAIHEAMEQHTISIAKAGIVATLNARAAIIAAANPKFGRYNPYKDPADNINLPTTVLSRFDLIFIMQDKPDPKEDRLKARHILRLHERRRVVEPPIPPDSLRKYISYSKQNIRPSITTEAAERIEEFYMDMRTTDRPDSPIAITPRQLEGLIRLAEARARMRLSPEVAVEDAETAIRLVNSSLKEVGMDTETGAIDALTLMTGRSQRSRSVMERIMDIIKEMSKEVEGTQVKIQDIINKAMEEGISDAVARDTIQKLKNEGDLYEPRVGYIRPP